MVRNGRARLARSAAAGGLRRPRTGRGRCRDPHRGLRAASRHDGLRPAYPSVRRARRRPRFGGAEGSAPAVSRGGDGETRLRSCGGRRAPRTRPCRDASRADRKRLAPFRRQGRGPRRDARSSDRVGAYFRGDPRPQRNRPLPRSRPYERSARRASCDRRRRTGRAGRAEGRRSARGGASRRE